MSTELPLTGIKAPSLSRYCISEVRYLERRVGFRLNVLSSETKQYLPSGSVDTVRGSVCEPGATRPHLVRPSGRYYIGPVRFWGGNLGYTYSSAQPILFYNTIVGGITPGAGGVPFAMGGGRVDAG